jgi:hypothetical protein
MELRVPIIQDCNEITEDTCYWVINNTIVHVEEVARWWSYSTLESQSIISMQGSFFPYVNF